MVKQMYLETPVNTEYAEDFYNFCNSSVGFTVTKKQPGFISAELTIFISENGKKG